MKPTQQLEDWLGRPLNKRERLIFTPLERLRLAGRPLRVIIADGGQDSEAVAASIVTYVAWYRHCSEGGDIMFSAPQKRIARRYIGYCRHVTEVLDKREPSWQHSRLLAHSGRKPGDLIGLSYRALVIFNGDLYSRRLDAFDSTYAHGIPALCDDDPGSMLIIHGTYYRSHRACSFSHFFRFVLAGYTDLTPVLTSDAKPIPRHDPEHNDRTGRDPNYKPQRYYLLRQSRIRRLAGEILPGCCMYPPDDATLDTLDDIDILNRYDMWGDIPPRPVYSYPKIKIRRYADRAVLPEPRTKNTSSSDNPNSPLSPYFIKKKRDWTLTHSDEDIKRYRELCSRTVNRCPLQEMPAYPPTYPAADPHIFARRRRAGRHPLSARDFPEADDCLYLPVRDAMTHTLLPPWSDPDEQLLEQQTSALQTIVSQVFAPQTSDPSDFFPIISDTFAAEPSASADPADSSDLSDPDELLLEQQTSALQTLVSQVFASDPSDPSSPPP